MGEMAGRYPQRLPRGWWLRALNVELLVALAAFLTIAPLTTGHTLVVDGGLGA